MAQFMVDYVDGAAHGGLFEEHVGMYNHCETNYELTHDANMLAFRGLSSF